MAAAGPFSSFPGVDRTLLLCRGAGMVLDIDGRPCTLGEYEQVRFGGEQSTSAELVDGPTVDLNVMTRRDRLRSEVTVLELGDGEETMVRASAGDVVMVVALSGTVVLHSAAPSPLYDTPLRAFDAVRLGAEPCRFAGPGRLARIVLRPIAAVSS